MAQDTTPITATRFFRQDSKPPSAPDGARWVTDSDGSGGDTSSRYIYNADADRWELDSAVGPSEPSLGTPVAGALWRDSSSGAGKQYDGTGFVSLTPPTTGGGSAVPFSESANQSGGFIEGGTVVTVTVDFGEKHPVSGLTVGAETGLPEDLELQEVIANPTGDVLFNGSNVGPVDLTPEVRFHSLDVTYKNQLGSGESTEAYADRTVPGAGTHTHTL
jgi:hypothetical protein